MTRAALGLPGIVVAWLIVFTVAAVAGPANWPVVVAGALYTGVAVYIDTELRDREGHRWIGDLRPGTRIEGPGRGEVWTVMSTTMSVNRGNTPTLHLDLIAGALPRTNPTQET